MNVLSQVILLILNFVALNHLGTVSLIKRHVHCKFVHLCDLVVMMVLGNQHLV